MEYRLIRKWLELPGPVWVFGAWALMRFASFARAFPHWAGVIGDSGSLRMIGIYSLGGLQSLLPLAVVWCLIRRKRFALSFACWYVAVRVIRSFFAILFSLFSKPGPLLRHVDGDGLCGIVPALGGMVLWLVFWRFLESDCFDGLFPRQERRPIPWWAVVLVVGILLAGELALRVTGG